MNNVTPQTLLEQVKAVLAQEWNLSPAAIPDNAALNQVEYWDSLGHIKIMMALEAQLKIEMTADTIRNLSSISKIVDYLATKNNIESVGSD